MIRAKLPPEAGALVVKAIETGALPQCPDGSAESSAVDLRQLAPNVTPQTCVPRWYGERCDYGMAVDGLLRRDTRSG